MLRTLLLFLAVARIVNAQSKPVVIDGDLSDVFWNRTTPGKLIPTESGTAAVAGGEVRAILAGRYLHLGAQMPEPSGRFTARSIGKNPRWEEEDRLAFVIRVSSENDWRLEVGPLGAFSVKWHW